MLLNIRNLKHHVAAANSGRYALNAIALTKRGTLSTDGHALLFIPYEQISAKDAPKIEGVNTKSKPPKLALLDTADAAKAVGMVASKGRRSTQPAFELIHAEVRDDTIVLGATDGAAAQVMTCKQAEGQYPDVSAVIPDYTKSSVASFEIDQLIRSLKALKGATRESTVTLRVIDDQQALGLSCRDGTAMLVMPVQVDKPEDHVPDQLAQLRKGGPGVASPAEPEEEDDQPEDWEPTEAEMAEAYDAFTALTPIPVAATA